MNLQECTFKVFMNSRDCPIRSAAGPQLFAWQDDMSTLYDRKYPQKEGHIEGFKNFLPSLKALDKESQNGFLEAQEPGRENCPSTLGDRVWAPLPVPTQAPRLTGEQQHGSHTHQQTAPAQVFHQ